MNGVVMLWGGRLTSDKQHTPSQQSAVTIGPTGDYDTGFFGGPIVAHCYNAYCNVALIFITFNLRERSGSVVECLT